MVDTRFIPAGDLAHARRAVVAVFFLNSLVLSTFIARAPSLKAEHHLTDGAIGAVGLLFGLAAIATMQFVGPLVARVGSRTALRITLPAMCGALATVGLSKGVVGYAGAAVLLGATHGMTDAAMNAHAVAVERRLGCPILNSCHAAWSASAVGASLLTAATVALGIPTDLHFGTIGAAVLGASLLVGAQLLPSDADRAIGQGVAHTDATPVQTSWRTGWSRLVVLLGLTGMALMICEGAALGWSAIFLHDGKGASAALAALAVTGYTGGQTVGRIVGDRLEVRFGVRPLFRTGGLIGVGGLALAVCSPSPLTSIVGFTIFGVGGSVLVPLTFGAAGHAGGDGPGAATFVSRFATFTYGGVLLGPALIGWVSESIGLTATMATLIPLLAVVALLSRLPSSRRQSATSRPTAQRSERSRSDRVHATVDVNDLPGGLGEPVG